MSFISLSEDGECTECQQGFSGHTKSCAHLAKYEAFLDYDPQYPKSHPDWVFPYSGHGEWDEEKGKIYGSLMYTEIDYRGTRSIEVGQFYGVKAAAMARLVADLLNERQYRVWYPPPQVRLSKLAGDFLRLFRK